MDALTNLIAGMQFGKLAADGKHRRNRAGRYNPAERTEEHEDSECFRRSVHGKNDRKTGNVHGKRLDG